MNSLIQKLLHKHKDKPEPTEERMALVKSSINEIIKLERDIKTLKVEDSLDRFDKVAKKFFSAAFNINYEFTYTELEQEMLKRGININKFIEKIDELKYSGEPTTAKDVEDLLGHLRYLARKSKLFEVEKSVKKKETNLFSDIKEKLDLLHLKKKHNIIRHKINRGIQNINLDLNSSIKDYVGATLDYYQTPEKKNPEMHKRLQELHKGLKKTKAYNKDLMKISKRLVEIKHKNKQVSVEGINLINKLKRVLEEPMVISDNLQEAAESYQAGARKLGRNISGAVQTEEDTISHNVKDIGSGLDRFGSRLKRIVRKDINKVSEEKEYISQDINIIKKIMRHKFNIFGNRIKRVADKDLLKLEEKEANIANSIGDGLKSFKSAVKKDVKQLGKKEEKIVQSFEHELEKFGRNIEGYNEKLDIKVLDKIEDLSKKAKNIKIKIPKPTFAKVKPSKYDVIEKKPKVLHIKPPEMIRLKALKLQLPKEPKIYTPKAIRHLEHEKNLIYKRLQNIEQEFNKNNFN